MHVLGIWALLARDPLVIKPPAGGKEGAITYVAPLADAAAQKPAPAPITLQPSKPSKPAKLPELQARKPKPAPKSLSAPARLVRRTPLKIPDQPAQAASSNGLLTPTPNVANQQDAALAGGPSEEFSARIEAARKRRSDAQEQDPSVAQVPAESDAQRANRIARENIAFQQRGPTAEQDQTGGVFQLREVGLHNAAFMFRGWNTNFRRNWNQVVEVSQGTEVDIEVAVVKRMIALIRSHKSGEFIWDSRRLGRQITLNAEPAYERELQTFLLKEFFPTYVRTNGR
ncbi:MAG: hypothetical protein NVSMB6_16110 [Burkholderiaceae bacterium]